MRRTSSLILPALLLTACAGDEPTTPATTETTAEAATAHSSAHPRITVLMSGLDAPRGLAWGPEGGLYVAEAGTPVITGPCATVARGPNCYSGTGAVSRSWRGRQERVVSGLPSAFNTMFADIIGPNDISFAGHGRGNAYVSIGWGGDPAARAELGDLGGHFGALLQLTRHHGEDGEDDEDDGEWNAALTSHGPRVHWRVAADVAGFERTNNPAGGPFDSNPFGILSEPGQTLVTDAGGNSLLRVNRNGRVRLVATFPATPAPPPFGQSDAVPTEVQRGRDGALYVSTLSGVPFVPGAAKIYRVGPRGASTVYADGFKTITDFTFGPHGSLYVLEYASGPFLTPPGRVVRVARNGTRTVITTALTNPTGILVDRHGVIYVSNRGNSAGVGEVLKIVP